MLVVDDDLSVATFMRALLESWGLLVTLASSAAEAIALVKRGLASFDLLISDQMMPRMTGVELAQICPELPVLLYTGHAESIEGGESEAAGVRAILTKPVDPHTLFGLLRTNPPAQGVSAA